MATCCASIEIIVLGLNTSIRCDANLLIRAIFVSAKTSSHAPILGVSNQHPSGSVCHYNFIMEIPPMVFDDRTVGMVKHRAQEYRSPCVMVEYDGDYDAIASAR